MEIKAKESLDARLDMKIQPSLKDKLQKLANKDQRELSDYLRIHLCKIAKISYGR